MTKLLPWIRAAFVAGMAAYLLGVLIQATLAGVALFVPPEDNFDLHRNFGYLVHLGSLAVIALGLLSRPGQPLIWWILVWGVVAFFQPFLPVARADMPYLAATHPVFAVIGFGLGLRNLTQTSSWLREFGRAS